jgi:DNA-binding CsgD family transcriptional regulator
MTTNSMSDSIIDLMTTIRTSCPMLSAREREVVAYLAAGFTHDQTANRIGLSPHTVDTYVRRVRVKLGAGNKAELIRLVFLGGSAARLDSA